MRDKTTGPNKTNNRTQLHW